MAEDAVRLLSAAAVADAAAAVASGGNSDNGAAADPTLPGLGSSMYSGLGSVGCASKASAAAPWSLPKDRPPAPPPQLTSAQPSLALPPPPSSCVAHSMPERAPPSAAHSSSAHRPQASPPSPDPASPAGGQSATAGAGNDSQRSPTQSPSPVRSPRSSAHVLPQTAPPAVGGSALLTPVQVTAAPPAPPPLAPTNLAVLPTAEQHLQAVPPQSAAECTAAIVAAATMPGLVQSPQLLQASPLHPGMAVVQQPPPPITPPPANTAGIWAGSPPPLPPDATPCLAAPPGAAAVAFQSPWGIPQLVAVPVQAAGAWMTPQPLGGQFELA